MPTLSVRIRARNTILEVHANACAGNGALACARFVTARGLLEWREKGIVWSSEYTFYK